MRSLNDCFKLHGIYGNERSVMVNPIGQPGVVKIRNKAQIQRHKIQDFIGMNRARVQADPVKGIVSLANDDDDSDNEKTKSSTFVQKLI